MKNKIQYINSDILQSKNLSELIDYSKDFLNINGHSVIKSDGRDNYYSITINTICFDGNESEIKIFLIGALSCINKIKPD